MEKLYHYIWKHKLLRAPILTVDGHTVKVIYQGRHNHDAGPDFLGARLRIDDEEWAGNVEIHVKASDWNRHRHSSDPAYSNVILHVVGIDDLRIPNGRGGLIPQTIVTFPQTFVGLYSQMAEKISDTACKQFVAEIPPLSVRSWLETLAVERMQQKSKRVLDTVRLVDGDWQRGCFITLARALGFSLNADPMEMLARSVPLSVLMKHSDDIMQLEALLFGQAGMLDPLVNVFDEHYQKLCREYSFLARKYELKPLRREIWKYARTRPQNFPEKRIAQLARAALGGFSLLDRILQLNDNFDSAKTLFEWEPTKSNVHLLLINMVAPVLYAYGAWRGEPELAERGLDLWRDLDAENNYITRLWKASGIECESAADSQALIQLHKEYCETNRCLECRFAHAMLRTAMTGSHAEMRR